MKKAKLERKLELNKEAIANLSKARMQKVNGGGPGYTTTLSIWGCETNVRTHGAGCCGYPSFAITCQ